MRTSMSTLFSTHGAGALPIHKPLPSLAACARAQTIVSATPHAMVAASLRTVRPYTHINRHRSAQSRFGAHADACPEGDKRV
jgi:hypothetical protein